MERANTMDGLMALFGSKDGPEEVNPQIQATQTTHQYATQSSPAGPDTPTAVTFPWMEVSQQPGTSLQQTAGPPMEQLDGLKFDEILELFNSDMDMPDFIGGALVAPEEWQQEPQEQEHQQGSQQQDAAVVGGQHDQDQAFQQQFQLLESLTMDLDVFGDVNVQAAGPNAAQGAEGDAAMTDASASRADTSLHLSTADTATSMEQGFSSLLSAVGLGGLLPSQQSLQMQEQKQDQAPPEATGSPPMAQQPWDPAIEEPGERWGDATAPDGAERPRQHERPDYMKQMADALQEKERKKAVSTPLSTPPPSSHPIPSLPLPLPIPSRLLPSPPLPSHPIPSHPIPSHPIPTIPPLPPLALSPNELLKPLRSPPRLPWSHLRRCLAAARIHAVRRTLNSQRILRSGWE